jgi:hypothetical protein
VAAASRLRGSGQLTAGETNKAQSHQWCAAGQRHAHDAGAKSGE